jgi:TusA-related sulfurtransferase
MENNWIKIYTTNQSLKAEMVKALFKDNGIEVVDINKQVSMYQFMGNIELYVHETQFDIAIELISKSDI